MNGTAVKEKRRNIRRALGPDALAIFEHHGRQLDDLTALVDTLNAALSAEQAARAKAVGEERTAKLKLAEEQRAYVDRENSATRDALIAFRGAGLWARLKWLFFGKIPRPGLIV